MGGCLIPFGTKQPFAIFNTEGQLISLVDKATNQTTVYEYDASGRILRETATPLF